MYQYGSKQYLHEDGRDKRYLKSCFFSGFWVDVPPNDLPLLDGAAYRSSDPFGEQPRLPALSTLKGVTSEERLQGGCLVPSHQQLWVRVLVEPTHISWNKDTNATNQRK